MSFYKNIFPSSTKDTNSSSDDDNSDNIDIMKINEELREKTYGKFSIRSIDISHDTYDIDYSGGRYTDGHSIRCLKD